MMLQLVLDIENTAAQVVNYYNPVSKTVEKPEQTNCKNVLTAFQFQWNSTSLNVWKVVNLKLTNSSFVLEDTDGVEDSETVKNDAAGKTASRFSKLEFTKDHGKTYTTTQ